MSAEHMDAPPRMTLLGTRVDLVTPAHALNLMQRFATDGGVHHVITLNPEFIMTAQRDETFRAIIERADLVLPDGIGVIWASRLHGRPLGERVTGVDTVRALARFAAQRHLRPFLLGAAPGVAETAARILQAENPGLEIAGAYAGSPGVDEEDAIVSLIQAARPDLLFVAYGAPKQDLWIARNRERLRVPVSMGVGGTFDFITGKAQRAPHWMQRAGIEWLHRLIQEPWRWRRMLALPRFALGVLAERMGFTIFR
jgi:N-acetylglucosaminyldiphosphoundecaprenol N-acetyl-beta-D-mannosaminyltransferase